MCLSVCLILHCSTVLLLYYNIALCEAFRIYRDFRHTNTILTDCIIDLKKIHSLNMCACFISSNL